MIIQKIVLLCIFLFCTPSSLCEPTLSEEFTQTGYVELCNTKHGAATFDALYAVFDEFIDFLQTHPAWEHKLYNAKERFIRSRDREYYATDFFGFYDESQRVGRSQISFYYSIHLHAFISTHYPEFNQVPAIIRFLDACHELQKPYADLFHDAATALGVETMFTSEHDHLPIILKVVKYLPSYTPTRPHYDGTALSLLLDSTDNQSLLLSAYKPALTFDDFSPPVRKIARSYNQTSMLLIPGTLLAECGINPTPHIVTHSGTARYATVAFAMRPYYIPQTTEFSPLPHFEH